MSLLAGIKFDGVSRVSLFALSGTDIHAYTHASRWLLLFSVCVVISFP